MQAVAFVQAGHYILVYELISPIFVVISRKLFGFAEYAESFEMYSLHEVGPFDVEPGNDPDIVHFRGL
jgi:hypothetical protein